jgi:hypothetical protein
MGVGETLAYSLGGAVLFRRIFIRGNLRLASLRLGYWNRRHDLRLLSLWFIIHDVGKTTLREGKRSR